MADNTDTSEEIERGDSLILDCGATPKLSDLELNVISDEINYVCDDVLFAVVMKDENRAYKLVLDNDIQLILDALKETPQYPEELNDMQKQRFKDIGVTDNNSTNAVRTVITKMGEFLFPTSTLLQYYENTTDLEECLDRLVESLEGINGKKESLAKTVRWTVQPVIYMYIGYIIVKFYYYGKTLFDEDGGAVKAEEYNIGFASQSTYAALLMRYAKHYEKYCKIVYTDGDLNSGVCSSVKDIVANISIFYKKLICYKQDNSSDECVGLMRKAMYELYRDKYVNNIFIAAKSGFKNSVNSINNFVEKQRKFLLREENFDVNYTADNEAFEHVYRVFLHNAGVKLFKDDRSATVRRNELKTKHQSGGNYDTFIKDDLLEPFINILSDPENVTDARSTDLIRMVTILSDMKKEYLPEYIELVDLIFNIDTRPYFNYSNTKYVEESMINIANLKYVEKHSQYFSEVRDKMILGGSLTMAGNSINADVTKTTLLTKIQARKTKVLTLEKLYEDFQLKIRTTSLSMGDIKEGGEFFDVFTNIKEDFNTVTEEYKLTKTIVMTYMNSYLESDEEFENDPNLRGTVKSNIQFVVGTILSQLKISRDIKNNVLNTTNPNLTKYISFMKFENKLTQLDENDLLRLFKYVKQINTTMRTFRKYVKSEEISYSKKYQIAEIYDAAITESSYGAFVLIIVYFYDMIESDDKLDALNTVGSTARKGMSTAKGIRKGIGKGIGEGMSKARSKAASFTTSSSPSAFKSAKSTTSTSSGTFITAAQPEQKGVSGRIKKLFGRGGDSQSFDDTAQENAPAVVEKKADTRQGDEKVLTKSKKFSVQVNDIIVQFAAVVAAWIILAQFSKSYLTKYKTDINYDKVTNITNTEIFEVELDKYERHFRRYIETKRDTKVCKELYIQLMKTLEAYEQCNFVKGSFKSTPFPATEMLTNGLLLVICFFIFYVAYTGTGMKDRQKNSEKLRAILEEEISGIDSSEVMSNTRESIRKDISKKVEKSENRMKEKWYRMKEKWYKVNESWERAYQNKNPDKWVPAEESSFRKELIKFMEKYDKDLDKQGEEDKKKGNPKELVDSKKDEDTRNAKYLDILRKYDSWHDKEEGQGETGFPQTSGGDRARQPRAGADAAGQTGTGLKTEFNAKGGNRAQFGVSAAPAASGVGQGATTNPRVSTATGQENVAMMNNQYPPVQMDKIDLEVEKALLQQYTKKKDNLEAQLITMQRDTGYVNWILAGAILCFSFYFKDTLQQNTNRYKKVMTGGGSYTRECVLN